MKRVATIVLGTLIMAFGYYYLNEQFGLAEGGFVGQAVLAAASLSLSYAMWDRLDLLTFDIQVWPATLFAAIASGIVTGYGLGLVLKSGGATGGDDLFALGLSKWTGVSVGTILIIFDVIVLAISLIYLPLSNALYTLLAVSIAGRVVTKMLTDDVVEITVPSVTKLKTKNDLA